MRPVSFCLLLVLLAATSAAAIRRDPNGVNVSSQGATSVFITFGDLNDQVPVEAEWCGTLVPAAPAIGLRCDPATVFGRLPIRFDQSRLAANGRVFSDVMTIPPSVARRAYQAATRGETSSFFYVRRFVSLSGGPDEYVFVTCRLAGGGARVPFALLDVRLHFENGDPVLAVDRDQHPERLSARIAYNGTGRLRGRWEAVLPGEDPPTERDLLTAASLPPEERALQRRYTEIGRFDVFAPPTGQIELAGPDPRAFPTAIDGLYTILLRIEASDDREGDSNLAAAGAGTGVIHAGAVAGFPLPVARYVVGGSPLTADLQLLAPREGAQVDANEPLAFSWSQLGHATLYRLELAADPETPPGFAAVVQQGIGRYQPPSWLAERFPEGSVVWRVAALGVGGDVLATTPWRELLWGARTPPTPAGVP